MTPEQHAELMRALGRIEGKIDIHLTEDATTHIRHDNAINAAHRRIDDHDKFRARVKGGTAVVGVIAAVVSTAVMALPNWLK